MSARITSVVALFPLMLLGDAVSLRADGLSLNSWLGRYSINRNGHVDGTLVITDSKVECSTPSWCAMRASFEYANGDRSTCSIVRMDQGNMLMVLRMGNSTWEIYLFSFDTDKMAGIVDTGPRQRNGFIGTRLK